VTVLGEATVAELRGQLAGDVLTSRDPGYDDARRVWNGDINRYPQLVARCTGVADVMAVIRFARSRGALIAVRGGGHHVAGFGTVDEGIVIDLSPMKGIRVDPHKRMARVQGGVVWGELDYETQAFGLATTGGLVSTTGIAGYTLGGGIGWLMRAHGLAVDNLLAADVVTADGELITADESSNPDLLWGLRGGGGNFGIVTSFKYSLHPVGPVVYGGAVFHPIERAADLLRFYRDWAPCTPDSLTTMVAFISAPAEPFIPADLVGTPMVAIAVCYTGPTGAGEEAVAPLRAFARATIDGVGPMPYVTLQAMFDASAPRGAGAYWKTDYLDQLTDPAVATLVEHATALRGLCPLSTVHLHHLGGAVARVEPAATAFAHRHHPFVANIIGAWTNPAARGAHVAWARTTWEALRPYATGAPYLNFLGDEGSNRVYAAYGADHYQRLVALKDRYDPDNLWRLNHTIPPTGR
jgi:FAD/FMN-containing dehydrogenase